MWSSNSSSATTASSLKHPRPKHWPASGLAESLRAQVPTTCCGVRRPDTRPGRLAARLLRDAWECEGVRCAIRGAALASRVDAPFHPSVCGAVLARALVDTRS
eukprot:964183-Rhodomonas_salina.1